MARRWDDYAGVDVKGKLVLIIVGDPPSDDPKFFAGKALTYYGRWTYKYEQTARRGAIVGPGEGGDVTRLVRSPVKGYFVPEQSQDGKGGRVCEGAMPGGDVRFGEASRLSSSMLLLNFTMDPPTTIEQMVDAILKAIGRERRPLSVPPRVLLSMAYPLSAVERVLRMKLPINRTRLLKLIHSNNVCAEMSWI
jgi:hypothetical protein